MVPVHLARSRRTAPPSPPIQYSRPAMLGQLLQHLFAPIGFNWQISIALVPGLAAREVAVGALGTVYALSAAGDALADSLAPVIAQGWSLATAYSLLAWYVFAPQCLSTLAVVRRETNSWRYPLLMLAYLFVLADAAAFVTYRVTLWIGRLRPWLLRPGSPPLIVGRLCCLRRLDAAAAPVRQDAPRRRRRRRLSTASSRGHRLVAQPHRQRSEPIPVRLWRSYRHRAERAQTLDHLPNQDVRRRRTGRRIRRGKLPVQPLGL